MKISKIINTEKGFALILAIVLMAAMAAIGIAVITTSTTDMLIARNGMEAKRAFYLAEMGLEEAYARLGLKDGTPRQRGETLAQRKVRIAAEPNPDPLPYDGGEFSSDDSIVGLIYPSGLPQTSKGSYTVQVNYALEGADSWTYDVDGDDVGDGASDPPRIILYCKGFGIHGSGGSSVPETCITAEGTPDAKNAALPVYLIESVGRTSTGTESRIKVYVTTASINTEPPSGEIFGMGPNGISVGGGADIAASACANSLNYSGGGSCEDDPNCTNSCSSNYNDYSTIDMENYLGLSLDDMRGYADRIYDHDANSSLNVDTAGWGDICSVGMDDDDDGITHEDPDDVPEHICGNDSEIVFVDNRKADGTSAGALSITGGNTGRGILIVRGDLDLSGGFQWEGMVYVMGDLKAAGTVDVVGTIMVKGDIDITGDLSVFGSIDVANSVTINLGIPRILRWYTTY